MKRDIFGWFWNTVIILSRCFYKKNHFFPSESFLYWWSLIIDSLGSSIKRDWLIFCSFFSGQFATVYRVLERHTGHEYAAKFIKKKRLETSRRGVAREDIQKEIHILAEMEHANIIYLHQVYENGQNVILVLELWVSEQQFHFYFHHLPLQYSVWKRLKKSHLTIVLRWFFGRSCFLLARNNICRVMWESETFWFFFKHCGIRPVFVKQLCFDWCTSTSDELNNDH